MPKKSPPKIARNSKPSKRAAPLRGARRGGEGTSAKPKKSARPAPASKVRRSSKTERPSVQAGKVTKRTKAAGVRESSPRRTLAPSRARSDKLPITAEPEVRAETFLTADEVEQFRHMLLEKRAEILGDMSTLHNEAMNKDRRDAAGDLSSMPIHMADLGTDNYELEFTLGLIEGERAILREIDEALERIRQKTYGVCLATGKPIGKARLKAKPWAKYCYEYTLAQEQGQGRRF